MVVGRVLYARRLPAVYGTHEGGRLPDVYGTHERGRLPDVYSTHERGAFASRLRCVQRCQRKMSKTVAMVSYAELKSSGVPVRVLKEADISSDCDEVSIVEVCGSFHACLF